MDGPKTRRESKKDPKEKAQGKNGKYSSKHVRFVEAIQEKTSQQTLTKGKKY
jgi:hypothetical protein